MLFIAQDSLLFNWKQLIIALQARVVKNCDIMIFNEAAK